MVARDVVWMLTKKWNCGKRKWQGGDWTSDGFSKNGMHNASGFGETVAVTIEKKKFLLV